MTIAEVLSKTLQEKPWLFTGAAGGMLGLSLAHMAQDPKRRTLSEYLLGGAAGAAAGAALPFVFSKGDADNKSEGLGPGGNILPPSPPPPPPPPPKTPVRGTEAQVKNIEKKIALRPKVGSPAYRKRMSDLLQENSALRAGELEEQLLDEGFPSEFTENMR